MAKKVIRITESQLRNIVKEVTYRIVEEFAPENQHDIHDLWSFEESLINEYGVGMKRIGNMLQEQKLLYEGLILSYDIDILSDRLKSIGVDILNINKQNYTTRIYATIPPDKQQQTQQLLIQCGWYNISPSSDIATIVPKFGELANDYVYETNKGILYHVTPKYYSDKVMAQGLVPKSKHKIDRSQDLVHLLTDKNECISLSYSLSSTTSIHPREYSLFKIDLNKLHKDHLKPLFYFDPQYTNGVVTLENIPPYCLTKLCDYELS